MIACTSPCVGGSLMVSASGAMPIGFCAVPAMAVSGAACSALPGRGRCGSLAPLKMISVSELHETPWNPPGKRVWSRDMGHCKGKDNVKKRAVRRKKTERLALAKSKATAAK